MLVMEKSTGKFPLVLTVEGPPVASAAIGMKVPKISANTAPPKKRPRLFHMERDAGLVPTALSTKSAMLLNIRDRLAFDAKTTFMLNKRMPSAIFIQARVTGPYW